MTTEVLFQKRTVAELSENEMVLVDGGTSLPCAAAVGVGIAVAGAAVVFVAAAVVGYVDAKTKQCQ